MKRLILIISILLTTMVVHTPSITPSVDMPVIPDIIAPSLNETIPDEVLINMADIKLPYEKIATTNWKNWTDWTHVGGTLPTWDEYIQNTPYTGYWTQGAGTGFQAKISLRNVFTKTFSLTIEGHNDIYTTVKVGANYYTFLFDNNNGDVWLWKGTAEPVYADLLVDYDEKLDNVLAGGYQYYHLVFNDDDSIDIYKGVNENQANAFWSNTPVSSIALTDMTFGGTFTTTWDSEELLSELHIGHKAVAYATGFTMTQFYLNVTEEGGQILGTADLGDVKDISSTKAFGGGGGANIISYYDATTADIDTDIRANYRKSIIIRESTYGNVVFVGEIVDIKTVRDGNLWIVNYRAEEDLKKLTKQFCRVTPIQLLSEIKKVEDNVVHDYLGDWSVDEFVDKLMVTKDDDLYAETVFPVSVSNSRWVRVSDTWYVQAPDNVGGDVNNLYFDDLNEGEDNVYGAHYDVDITQAADSMRQDFTFKIYERDAPINWDKINVKIKVRFTSFKGSKVDGVATSHYPQILKWNYTTSAWVLVHQYYITTNSDANVEDDDTWETATIEAADNDLGKSPIFETDINMVLTADHRDTLSAENAAGFKSYEFKISVKSCDNPEDIDYQNEPKIEIHYLGVDFSQKDSKTDPQGQNFSVGKIASNTATSITLDNTANASLSVVDFPQADGVVKEDDYYISDNLEEVVVDIFATADTNFTLNTDFDGDYTDFGEIDDIYDTPIHDYIRKITNIHNMAFWSASTVSTGIIKIADNFDYVEDEATDPLVITGADIMNYAQDGLSLMENSKVIRDRVTVVGAEGIRVSIDNTGVVYTDTLGEEEIIYRDDELYTKSNITAYANTKAIIHQYPRFDIVITLDYTDPLQYYGNVDIGKAMVLVTDEWSWVYWGDLVIRSLVFTKMRATGDREFVTLYLQKRWLS